MSHLYEELAKRKALVEKVNKLQSEVDQLDSVKAVPEKIIFSSSPPSTSVSASTSTGISMVPSAQYLKALTTPSSTSSSSPTMYGSHSQKSVGSLVSGNGSSSAPISKSSAVMSVPVSSLSKSPSQAHQCSSQPQLINAYHPCLVQMVTYVDQDSRVTTSAPKTKQTSQKGNGAKKRSRATSQSKQEATVTLPSSPALLSPRMISTVASPSIPVGSLRQSPSVSRPFQPLITSPVTPVISSPRPRSELLSPVSLLTSPVTPTPVRQVTPMTSLVASGSEVPQMVSIAQNGLSYISPLSPMSTMSAAASRTPTSRVTPLSSLSASTEKYLNTFATQMATTTSTPSFSSASQSPCISTNQLSYVGRNRFPNTDLSTDHSAGIKLLCDLLNDTLPEQPPPLVATSLAARSLGTPTSLASAPSIQDSFRVEQKRHVDTPPALPSRSTSKSPKTSPTGHVSASPLPGGLTSSVEQPSSAQRTPTRSPTPPTGKKRSSPFTIDSLVSSSPETQTGKRKSPNGTEVEKGHPSPATTGNGSPKARNKSPSTNFSIAHITRDMNSTRDMNLTRDINSMRDMNSPNTSSKTRVPFVTSPGTYPLATSVSSDEVNQQQRKVSPLSPKLSPPGTEKGCRVEFSGEASLNKSSTGGDRSGRVPVPVLTGPDAHSVTAVGTPTEVDPPGHVKSNVVSDVSLKSVPFQQTKTDSFRKKVSVDEPKTDPSVSHHFKDKDRCSKETVVANRATVVSKAVSSEVSSSKSPVDKISSSTSSPTENTSATFFPEIPLDMIPLPSGKRPSPKKRTSPTNSSSRKRCSPVPQAPKSASPDSEVSSLMANESLPQSPSISSSVSKAGSTVLEGQAPVLVDSNPCSARSPIPVAPSPRLHSLSGVSLPSFGSVFSPTKEGDSVKLKKNR